MFKLFGGKEKRGQCHPEPNILGVACRGFAGVLDAESGADGPGLVTRDKLIMRVSDDDVVWECCNQQTTSYTRAICQLRPGMISLY